MECSRLIVVICPAVYAAYVISPLVDFSIFPLIFPLIVLMQLDKRAIQNRARVSVV